MENFIVKLDTTKKYILLLNNEYFTYHQGKQVVDAIKNAEGNLIPLLVGDPEKSMKFIEVSDNTIEVKVEDK
jgi:hypothetical protein